MAGSMFFRCNDFEPSNSTTSNPGHQTTFSSYLQLGLLGFLWRKDNDALQKRQLNGLEDGEGDSAKLWFANQLSHDACVCF